jgi:hypothetical protein
VTLHRLLAQTESSMVSVLAWIGLALAIMAASAFAVLQAVDGIALKLAVDSWVAAPPNEKVVTFKVAEGIRFMEYSTSSIFRILQGTVAVIFSVAIVKSKLLSKWICGAGVCYHNLCGTRSSLSGFWRSNNYNWYLHDNLFHLGWNSRWSYVEKINICRKCKYIKTLSQLHCAREEDELESAS